MDQTQIVALQTTFLDWYDQNKRTLPWRENQQPYYVWLSEIMLQQTQVQTVIPYFERFIATFPDLTHLAQADDAVLMKCWEGLGYYSRARNLKKAAQQILTDYHGVFPKTAKTLTELIGIGPYTAGAIASIAFNEAVPAVDGNAYRVFSRLLADATDISKSGALRHFQAQIQPFVPKDRPGDFNQAVMDLGSSLCTTKDPACLLCPLQDFCAANAAGTQLSYPVKTKKIKKKKVQLVALVIQDENGAYLVQQRPKTGLLAGLVTFPLVDLQALDETLSLAQGLQAYFDQQYALTLRHIQPLDVQPVTHIFTHLHWTVQLVAAQLPPAAVLDYFPGYFLAPTDFAHQAFPTVQKKLWQRLKAR